MFFKSPFTFLQTLLSTRVKWIQTPDGKRCSVRWGICCRRFLLYLNVS